MAAETSGSLQRPDMERIAQNLHERLGQTMAAIRICHDTMGLLRQGKMSPEVARLDRQMGSLIDQAVRELRQALADLHAPQRDEQGGASPPEAAA
ncbi:MAG: histidine kinase [Burkholderiales bacterium]